MWSAVMEFCDPTKIAIILDLPPLTIVKLLRETLGHTRYYINIIKVYPKVTALMENILKKDVKFQWKESYQDSLDALKNKMTNAPILVFLEWKKEFHVHVNVSSIMLNMVLPHPSEGSIDHPISFASRKLPTTEKSYTTTEREGLAMVYAL